MKQGNNRASASVVEVAVPGVVQHDNYQLFEQQRKDKRDQPWLLMRLKRNLHTSGGMVRRAPLKRS